MKTKLSLIVLMVMFVCITGIACGPKQIHPSDQAAIVIVPLNETYLSAVDTAITLRGMCGGSADAINPMCSDDNWIRFKTLRAKIMPKMRQLRAAWYALAKTEEAIMEFQQSELYTEIESLIDEIQGLTV